MNHQSSVMQQLLLHPQHLFPPPLLRLRRRTLQVVPHRKTPKTLICFSHSHISSFSDVIKLISRNSRTCQQQRVCCYQGNSCIPSQIEAIRKDIMIHSSKPLNDGMQNIKLRVFSEIFCFVLRSLIKEQVSEYAFPFGIEAKKITVSNDDRQPI